MAGENPNSNNKATLSPENKIIIKKHLVLKLGKILVFSVDLSFLQEKRLL